VHFHLTIGSLWAHFFRTLRFPTLRVQMGHTVGRRHKGSFSDGASQFPPKYRGNEADLSENQSPPREGSLWGPAVIKQPPFDLPAAVR
jgi:hypothetical protein